MTGQRKNLPCQSEGGFLFRNEPVSERYSYTNSDYCSLYSGGGDVDMARRPPVFIVLNDALS